MNTTKTATTGATMKTARDLRPGQAFPLTYDGSNDYWEIVEIVQVFPRGKVEVEALLPTTGLQINAIIDPETVVD